jgi:hypothetical protein
MKKSLFLIVIACMLPLACMAQQKRGLVYMKPDTQKVQIENKGDLSAARNINGVWEGTLTSSDNNSYQSHSRTDRMTLDIQQNGNNITGTMTFGNARGRFEGLINGAYLDFTVQIGNGCIKVHGSFTSTNMEGMRGTNPPPYITCGDELNDGHGSKGVEWHLQKK